MAAHSITRRQIGVLGVGGIAWLGSPMARAQARISIAAVNYPLAYFAERLAGEQAEIVFPVPAEVDPSFWRPSIRDIAAFQSADIILLNGAGFADWVARTTLPRARTVRTSSAFEADFIATETVTHSHGDGGAHSHTGTASYTWLDFTQAEQQAAAIAAALVRRRPDAEAHINAALSNLSADLGALDRRAREVLPGAVAIHMIASHPRYQYFARAYGLTVDAVDWDASTPPSPDQWDELAQMVSETGAGVFIWEAHPDPAALERIESLGLSNAVFPPLANRPTSGDFLTEMAASIDRLGEAVEVASSG